MFIKCAGDAFEHLRWIPAVVVRASDDVRCAVTEAQVARSASALLRSEMDQRQAVVIGADDPRKPVVWVLVDNDDTDLPLPGLSHD
jgi:hypothetical protein